MFFAKTAETVLNGSYQDKKKMKMQIAYNSVALSILVILSIIAYLTILWPPTILIAGGCAAITGIAWGLVYIHDNG